MTPTKTKPPKASFRGANLAAIRSTAPQLVLAGPAECVHGDTVLEGTGKTIRWFRQQKVQPIVQTLNGPKLAGVPFIKGRAAMFEVTTEDGNKFKATAKHLILTPGGFCFVESLKIGQLLVRYAPNRMASISERDQSIHGANVQHCTKTEPSSQFDYPACLCFDDELLPVETNSGLVFVPSPDDVLALGCADCDKDACDDEVKHSHQHQLSGRLANDYSVPRACRDSISSPAGLLSQNDERSGAWNRLRDLWLTWTSRLKPFSKPSRGSNGMGFSLASCFGQKRQFVSGSNELSADSNRVEQQYDLNLDAWNTLLRWFGFVQPSNVCNSCQPYSAHLTKVSSIQWTGYDNYYDLTVPDAHHYFAEGFIHHNTGKTFACCAKLHLRCQMVPNGQHAIVRKTFNSITPSVGKTWERIIKGYGVQTIGGAFPTRYVYPNGSTVWVGGMDNPDRVLSSERDTIYVAQAEELTESDWETLSTRCTGRGAVVKYPQLIGDCNPAGSKHWIRRKGAEGRIELLNATHRDNPTLYDAAGQLTEQGKRSLAALDTLTGVRRKRLLEGIWATAEGAVYDMFDSSIHVQTRDPAEMKRFFLAIDEGYTNPAVILVIGADADGRWHCFREFYKSGVLQAAVIEQAKAWFLEPAPGRQCELAAVDESAAGLIADMQNAGIYAIGGKGRVLDGIQTLQNRLRCAGDGRPRYSVDPACTNHINEFESYVWKPEKDVPEKEFDHSLDAARYLCDVLGEPTGAWNSAAIEAAQFQKKPAAEQLMTEGADGLDFTDLEIDV